MTPQRHGTHDRPSASIEAVRLGRRGAGGAARARGLGGLALPRVAHEAVQVAPVLKVAGLRILLQRDGALKQLWRMRATQSAAQPPIIPGSLQIICQVGATDTNSSRPYLQPTIQP